MLIPNEFTSEALYAWAVHSQDFGDSILSIYYRYLIQGTIHLESLYINVKILFLKKTGKEKSQVLIDEK